VLRPRRRSIAAADELGFVAGSALAGILAGVPTPFGPAALLAAAAPEPDVVPHRDRDPSGLL
jgi:hypothetical protein